MRFKAEQVARMLINPYEEDRGIFDVYPQLKEIQTDVDINWHQYFRYLSFVYDPYSPLIKEQDLAKRRYIAKEETGYEGDEHYMVVVGFLKKVVKNRDWTYIITLESNFDECIEILNKPIKIEGDKELVQTVDLKGKLRSQAFDIKTQLPGLYKEFYEGDKELEDVAALNYSSAEDVAKRLRGKK